MVTRCAQASLSLYLEVGKGRSPGGGGLWAKADGLTHKIILSTNSPYIWSPGVEEVNRRVC